MSRDLFVALAIPGQDYMMSRFAISLGGMLAYSAMNPIPGWDSRRVAVLHKQGSILPQMRNQLVEQALLASCTHLVFLDSDQTFPKNLLHQLLHWDKPVVACNVATKTFPSRPSARLESAESRYGELVYTEDGQKGLQEVWRIGTGIMLLNMGVFNKLERPWFEYVWKPEVNDFQGEDWVFCEKLQAAGYRLYIDHAASWDVGHMGTTEFKHDFVIGARDAGEISEKGFKEQKLVLLT